VRIGITYNLKSDILPTSHASLPEDAAEEFDLPETIEAIQNVLSQEGYEVHLLGGDLAVIEKIKRFGIEFVFNIAEGFKGRNREAHIPALLELSGIPYSGSDPLGLAMTLDKALAKRIAISLGIPTPEFWIVEGKENLSILPDRFPLFVKPLWQGSSIGIRTTSHVTNPAELEREVGRLLEHYPKEPILIEEFISGREFTVGLIGNEPPAVIGVMEISFSNPSQKDFCYSLEVKRNWKEQVRYQCPPSLKPEEEKQIRDAALQLFRVLRLRDVARFDFRMDQEGKIYFLEANPLPGLSPESGDLVILAQKVGLSYSQLICKILRSALERYPAFSQLKMKGSING